MFRVTRLAAVLAVAVVAVTLTACGPDDPRTTVDLDFQSDTDHVIVNEQHHDNHDSVTRAEENGLAADAIAAYWNVLDQLASIPTKSLTDLSTVAVDPALAQWQRILTLRRADQVTQVGTTVIDAPSATKKASDEWDATACIDVTKVTLVDKDGKSVVKADRPPRVRYAYVVKKINDKFYVMQDQAVGLC